MDGSCDSLIGWSVRGFYPHTSNQFTALLSCDVKDTRGANKGEDDPELQGPEGEDRDVTSHCVRLFC